MWVEHSRLSLPWITLFYSFLYKIFPNRLKGNLGWLNESKALELKLPRQNEISFSYL